jgi:uncharacterized membrane protein SirB2
MDKLAFVILYVVVGGWDVFAASMAFRDKRWFLFGVDIMLAVSMVALLIKNIL